MRINPLLKYRYTKYLDSVCATHLCIYWHNLLTYCYTVKEALEGFTESPFLEVTIMKHHAHTHTHILVAQTVKYLPAIQETWVQSLVGKTPWRRAWLPTPVFLPGESHGQKSLVGCSPWGSKESGMTGRLTLTLLAYIQKIPGGPISKRWDFNEHALLLDFGDCLESLGVMKTPSLLT